MSSFDVADSTQESFEIHELIKKASNDRLDAARKESVLVPKLGHIYCSGTWVNGSSNALVNDLMPVGTLNAPTPPAKLTS